MGYFLHICTYTGCWRSFSTKRNSEIKSLKIRFKNITLWMCFISQSLKKKKNNYVFKWPNFFSLLKE